MDFSVKMKIIHHKTRQSTTLNVHHNCRNYIFWWQDYVLTNVMARVTFITLHTYLHVKLA